LRRIGDLVSAHRIVTLLGPGGIGKTRLALEVAHKMRANFPDGTWLVELASLSDPAMVATAVAGAVGIDLGVSEVSPARLAEAIARRRMLMVLDNCEHLLDGVAGLAEAIIRAGPAPCVLATSQERLHIEGEHVHHVPGLEVPPEGIEAGQVLSRGSVELFIGRMRSAQADFETSLGDLADIATICRRLDGIPLAIELAAATAVAIGIAATAAHINNRFAILTRGRRTAPARHRTLRSMLDWSYNLLSDTERVVLHRLAIFAGGFDPRCCV
jgi:predicted ATPase